MTYHRNGKHKASKTKKVKRNKARDLTLAEVKAVETSLKQDILFLAELNTKSQFSVDWFNHVLKNIMFKCMGLNQVVVTNLFGQEIPTRIFNPKSAIESAKLLGKINGIKISPDIEVIDNTTNNQNNYFNVQLTPSSEKTASVIEILQSAGKFQELSQVK